MTRIEENAQVTENEKSHSKQWFSDLSRVIQRGGLSFLRWKKRVYNVLLLSSWLDGIQSRSILFLIYLQLSFSFRQSVSFHRVSYPTLEGKFVSKWNSPI